MSFKYLPDFLEYSAELPQIFRERLTHVRELDLDVNNREDRIKRLKDNVRTLRTQKFTRADPYYKSAEMEAICKEIIAELDQVVVLNAMKVQVVNSLEELMKRYNAHLDSETEKFKLELEADNPGSTIKLEARAREEMDMLLVKPMVPTTHNSGPLR